MHYALVTYVGWQARTAQLEKRIKIRFTFATYLTYPTPNGAECTPDLAMAMRTGPSTKKSGRFWLRMGQSGASQRQGR